MVNSENSKIVPYPSDAAAERHGKFRALASILLSGVCGALIAVPLAASAAQNEQAEMAKLIPFFGVALGLLCGYRRRHSSVYFYFCLLVVVVLASLITFKGLDTPLPT